MEYTSWAIRYSYSVFYIILSAEQTLPILHSCFIVLTKPQIWREENSAAAGKKNRRQAKRIGRSTRAWPIVFTLHSAKFNKKPGFDSKLAFLSISAKSKLEVSYQFLSLSGC